MPPGSSARGSIPDMGVELPSIHTLDEPRPRSFKTHSLQPYPYLVRFSRFMAMR